MAKDRIVNEARERELRALIEKDGLLSAERVVQFARNPSTALHSAFEWDNAKASHEYRLIQARNLIVSVKVVPPGGKREIQAFVSLQTDREKEGGGYRETLAVLATPQTREALLVQAMNELFYWRDKYQSFAELAPIFAAADNVAAKTKSRIGRPVARNGKNVAIAHKRGCNDRPRK